MGIRFMPSTLTKSTKLNEFKIYHFAGEEHQQWHKGDEL